MYEKETVSINNSSALFIKGNLQLHGNKKNM
jgi:hypothetical protein